MEIGQGQYVFHYRTPGDPEDMLVTLGFAVVGTIADPEDARYVLDAWKDTIVPFQSEAVTLTRMDIEQEVSGGTIQLSLSANEQGTRSGGALTQNVCYLIHKKTADVGRGHNGRLYLPGVPENKVNDIGIVDSGEVATLQDKFDEFYETIVVDFETVLVVNHGVGHAVEDESVITNFLVDPVVATQRRRLRNR